MEKNRSADAWNLLFINSFAPVSGKFAVTSMLCNYGGVSTFVLRGKLTTMWGKSMQWKTGGAEGETYGGAAAAETMILCEITVKMQWSGEMCEQ